MRGRTRRSRIAIGGVAALAVLGAGVAGGIAYANHTASHKTFSGRDQVAVRVATDTGAFSTSSPNLWYGLAGSNLGFVVPSGQQRLVRATFTAETFSAPGGSWCAVRVVAFKAGTSATFEFNPRAGDEFAFDSSAGADNWEGHAMKRVLLVDGGTWSFRVQLNAAGGGSCSVDDWYFEVEVNTVS